MNKYKINTPFYTLAPMANISTYPFASQCVNFGADLVFSPMIFSDAIIHNPEETLKIADLGCHPKLACSEFIESDSESIEIPDRVRNDKREGIKNYIVQIFGYDPENIAKAIKVVEKNLNPIGIDLNFGCPDKNVVKSGCGGAMLKDTKKLTKIVKAARNATSLPISVKTRSGWESSDEIFKLLSKLEKAGIDMLTVHPRTVKQGFREKADWSVVKKLKSEIVNRKSQMLLCGSGDILTWQEAINRQKETGCDGVMIGRGALGKPWIFKEIKDQKDHELDIREIKKLTLDLVQKAHKIWGEKGIRESRKHFAWYFRGFPGAQNYRKKLMTANDLDEIKKYCIN